jgi:hypothetical protein
LPDTNFATVAGLTRVQTLLGAAYDLAGDAVRAMIATAIAMATTTAPATSAILRRRRG